MRFSGALRTSGVTGTGAGLTVRVEQGSNLIAHDFMLDRLVKGDKDWHRVEVEIAVDPSATHLEIGVMLQGPGTVWFDDARLEALRPAPDPAAGYSGFGEACHPCDEALSAANAGQLALLILSRFCLYLRLSLSSA